MSLNFVLNEISLSTDTIINIVQNIVIKLPLPEKGSDFLSKKYLDEQLVTAFRADQVTVNSSSSEKETVQQSIERLTNQSKGFFSKIRRNNECFLKHV